MKVLLVFILLLPNFVFAQTIVINEVAWMGVPVEGVDAKQWWRYEWVELYNPGDQSIGLNGWTVELSREKLDLRVALHGVVEAQGYFLVASSNKIPGVDVNYGSLAGDLVNSGQRVILKNAASEVVEEIDARSGWIAGDNDLKLTMERRFPDRPANDPANWGSSQTTGGTPKVQNSLFQKEKFAVLTPSSPLTKKDSVRSLFLENITDTIFIKAFLVALLFAVAVLVLRRYLIRAEPNEGSSDVLRG